MADLSPGFSMITPRASRSSMSSNIHPPLMRRTSESSAHPSGSTSMPSIPSTIPSFRAIRNFLPFGPSKPSSPAQPPAQTKHPFHFASLRRSSDRKPSSSSVRDCQLDHDHDHHPVISITRLESEEYKSSYDLVRAASASDSLLPSSIAAQSTVVREEMYSPVHPCPADLSTILEADNSGISKHIPSPSPSPPPTSPQTFFPSQDTFLPKMFFPPPSQGTSVSSKDSPKNTFSPSTTYSQTSCDPSPSTSNLDLSLSKLSAELYDALSPTTADGWLSAVVVEDADLPSRPLPDGGSDNKDTSTGLPEASDPDATFDFSALDPDLAELLSPHHSKGKGRSAGANWLSPVPYGVGAIPITPSPGLQPESLVERSTTPLSLGSQSIDLPSRTPSSPITRIPTVSQPTTPLPSDALYTSSRLPRGAIRSPEPTPTSLSRPSLTARRTPSHLPRLMRSVTSATPSTPAATPGTCTETSTRVQMRQPPSPLSAGLVSADVVVQSPSDTARMRTSLDKGVPRPSMDTSPSPRPSTDTGTRNARVGSPVQKQHLTMQGHVSSPSGNFTSTRRATPSVPCITTTLVPNFTSPSSTTSSAMLTTPPSAITNANLTTPISKPSLTTSTPHDPTHLRRRRHPHLFFNRRRSFSVDEPSSSSAHPERPGSSASSQLNGASRYGLGVRNGDQTLGARGAEDVETQKAGGRNNFNPGENRLASSPLTRGMLTPLTRGPGPPTMEWLGPRTAKAFAAAGLFDGEREGPGARFGRQRAGSVSQFEHEHEHEREGAISVLSRYDFEREGATSVMSRFDRDRESSVGRYDRDRDHSTIHRYAALRDHAPSRAAFSEATSTSSFGTRSVSTAGNNGAGWSPSPTFSSTPRTAFSGSTAPTSVSSGVGSGIGTGTGVGAMIVNGTGPNGAFRILQEKHSVETSALLNALADSQETCRKLREENEVLRGRLRELEVMVNHDREDATLGRDGPDEEDAFEKTHNCDQDFDRFTRQHLTSLRVSPAHQSRTLTPIPCRPHIQRSHSHLPQHARHHSVSAKPPFDFTFRRSPSPSRFTESRDPSLQKRQPQPPSPLSIQPPLSPQKRQIQKQRRASTTSSLFPAPPPEMSMLMLEDVGFAASESPPSPGVSSFAGGKKLGHKRSYSHSMIPHSHSFYANQSGTFTSFASTGMVVPSPSTATFSMTEVPGSPHSLQLRPEHELHLGDMTSLSLYAMSDGDGEEMEDGWKDGV
ncbi:hypothetical protein AZE42_08658 [Rhizopogon vesiculosus]|uniref:Uncharacterized protein n=1 Tax=Rhizopogon vesiculosus TaxID=180088 RepID=A0A1J8QJ50_9AGAM|nr:hypothetical protein AZE42_08658 [Rhizopogon vesiculosus]